MEQIDYNERTCIIVVEVLGESGTVQIGIVVDTVSEVLNVSGKDILRIHLHLAPKSVIKYKARPNPKSLLPFNPRNLRNLRINLLF